MASLLPKEKRCVSRHANGFSQVNDELVQLSEQRTISAGAQFPLALRRVLYACLANFVSYQLIEVNACVSVCPSCFSFLAAICRPSNGVGNDGAPFVLSSPPTRAQVVPYCLLADNVLIYG